MKKIFIGSSKEAIEKAEEVAEVLGKIDDVEVDLWDQIADVSDTVLNKLANTAREYSGAIFVFSTDDKLISRGNTYKVTRDNVLFEYGLFTGAIGKKRVAYVRVDDAKILSDLDGITYIPYKANSISAYRKQIRKWVDSLPNSALIDDYVLSHRMFVSSNEVMTFQYNSLNSCIYTDAFDVNIQCDNFMHLDGLFSWVYGGDAKVSPVNSQDELIFERIENRNIRYCLLFDKRYCVGDKHSTGFKFEYNNTDDLSSMHLNFDATYDQVNPVVLKVVIPDNMEFVEAVGKYRDSANTAYPCLSENHFDVDGYNEIEFGGDVILKAKHGISLEWKVRMISS